MAQIYKGSAVYIPPEFRPKRIIAAAQLVIYRALDPDGKWEPITQEGTPDVVKQHDHMARLVGGNMMQAEGDPYWYRAERVTH